MIELSSRRVRENVLQAVGQIKLSDTAAGDVSVTRAKTAFQLKRNSSFMKACDELKKDARCRGKTMEIAWKIDGTKDRGIKSDGQLIFLQTPEDTTGKGRAPFQDFSV